MNTQSPPPDSVPPQPPQPPQPADPRRRLRELLSIPERDRTDAQWDEIVELEIQTAPGNRAVPAPAGGGSNRPPQQQQQKKPHFKSQGGGRQKPRK